MSVRLIVLATLAGLAAHLVPARADAPATTSSHPYFNDQGTLAWSHTLEEAKRAAIASNKIVFIEYGRKACTNCKQTCENVITQASIRERLSGIAVGLAADCDKPEAEVEALFRTNLPGAGTLPFVGFVTPDLKWIAGWSGLHYEADFLTTLGEVEKSALLQPIPPAAKFLDGLLAGAKKATDKGDWKTVLKAGRDASKVWGRCAARTSLDGAVVAAHTWATEQLDLAAKTVLDPAADVAAVRKSLTTVAGAFAGEPEGDDAKRGAKAIDRIVYLRGLTAGPETDKATAKAAAEFKDTRWAALFGAAAK